MSFIVLLSILTALRQYPAQHLSVDETARRVKYPSSYFGDVFDNPFVPDEDSREYQSMVEFTNNTREVSGLSVRVLAILNNEVANQTNAFSRLTFDYAGKKVVKGRTKYYLRISTEACFADDDFCQTLNCQLELEAATAAAEDASLAITRRTCARGTFCYFCDEALGVRCPRVDEFRPSNGNSDGDILQKIDCDHWSSFNVTKSENQTWTCTSEFHEVAGIRTYSRLGCLGQDAQEQERQCKSDQSNYGQVCTCAEPLCNNPYLVSIHPRYHQWHHASVPAMNVCCCRYQYYLENREIFEAIRQLRAHMDENLGKKERCAGGGR